MPRSTSRSSSPRIAAAEDAMRGHTARKRFGQNFLVDAHYVARIVDAIDPQPGDNLVEIGPGLAALTGRLIERAGKVRAIEIDRDLAARLVAEFSSDLWNLIIESTISTGSFRANFTRRGSPINGGSSGHQSPHGRNADGPPNRTPRRSRIRLKGFSRSR